ncbi:MAG: glycosyltransferase [Bacteroidales bacterium]|nr:glycosyltransferase [Bacteroidales bacterium]
MISIIIPIYNVEVYLDRCLRSVQSQTYTNFEVIMVDDGSTDRSADIAIHYAESDARFKYIKQSNSGQGSARNTGLKNALGDYYCFVDSDDYINPNYLSKLFNAITETNSDISVCSVERIFDDGRIIDYKITNQDRTSIITDINKYLILASFSVCNKLFKSYLFEDLLFPEGIKYEDFALIPRVYERASKIVTIQDKLYYYYYRQNSTTTGQKINEDIIKAQHILENSDFGVRHKDIVEIYFVRQVMGTLLWAMSQHWSYRQKVLRIVQEGLEKYPNLSNHISDMYIGTHKSFWGNLLLKGHYDLSCIYSSTYEFIRFCGRKILKFK